MHRRHLVLLLAALAALQALPAAQAWRWLASTSKATTAATADAGGHRGQTIHSAVSGRHGRGGSGGGGAARQGQRAAPGSELPDLTHRPIICVLTQVRLRQCASSHRALSLEGPAAAFLQQQDARDARIDDAAPIPDDTMLAATQPGDLAGPGESYVSAGYVKWLESAGARVAPVLFDLDPEDITEL